MSESSEAVAQHSTKKALADRLRETMRGTPQEAQIGPTSDMLYELLLIVHKAQVAYGRARANVRMKHRIRHAASDNTFALEITNIDVLGAAEIDALARFAGDCYSATRFQFRSPETDELLTYGVISLHLFPRGALDGESESEHAERVAARRASRVHYAAPDHRRKQTMQVDWQASVVLAADRAIVLELIDDVYNMH